MASNLADRIESTAWAAAMYQPPGRSAPRSMRLKSGGEVVQDPELSKNNRPLWIAIEASDLGIEFEHIAARGVQQRAIVGAPGGLAAASMTAIEKGEQRLGVVRHIWLEKQPFGTIVTFSAD